MAIITRHRKRSRKDLSAAAGPAQEVISLDSDSEPDAGAGDLEGSENRVKKKKKKSSSSSLSLGSKGKALESAKRKSHSDTGARKKKKTKSPRSPHSRRRLAFLEEESSGDEFHQDALDEISSPGDTGGGEDDVDDEVEIVEVCMGDGSIGRECGAEMARVGSFYEDDDIVEVPVEEARHDVEGEAQNLADDAPDDDLEVVGIQQAIVYPHSRSDCLGSVFSKKLTPSAHTGNMQKCRKCYCYVCDNDASSCDAWEHHCMAHAGDRIWRGLRKRKRDAPSEKVSIPNQLLPSALRVRPALTTVSHAPVGALEGDIDRLLARMNGFLDGHALL